MKRIWRMVKDALTISHRVLAPIAGRMSKRCGKNITERFNKNKERTYE